MGKKKKKVKELENNFTKEQRMLKRVEYEQDLPMYSYYTNGHYYQLSK